MKNDHTKTSSDENRAKTAASGTDQTTAKTAVNGFLAGSPWVYTEIVKDHFLNPRNFLMGDESKYDYDAKGIVGNPICGDQMLMFIKVQKIPKKLNSTAKAASGQASSHKESAKEYKYRITDVKWKTYGCASAIASTSALSELAKGRTLDEALSISAEEIEEYLGGLPKHKFHCSVLGHEALAAAIKDYQKRNNS